VGGEEKLGIDAFGFNQDTPMSNSIYGVGASNISNASTGRYHPDTDLECGSFGCFEKERKVTLDGSILGNCCVYNTPTDNHKIGQVNGQTRECNQGHRTVTDSVDPDTLPIASARLVQVNGVVF